MFAADPIETGHTYRLTFENSAEGAIECADMPLVEEMCCESADADYLYFERHDDYGTIGIEFFFHAHEGCVKNGQWWDENNWTRLVQV
jgi:hypothetical protein